MKRIDAICVKSTLTPNISTRKKWCGGTMAKTIVQT
nr:MAG TPA_asm: hypothetical protein [Caudoviricetes sp.]